MYFLFFFFSSRRRHTRCSRDWSSDVCSSDLAPASGSCSPAAGGPDRGTCGTASPHRSGRRSQALLISRDLPERQGPQVRTFGVTAVPVDGPLNRFVETERWSPPELRMCSRCVEAQLGRL